MIDCSLLKKAIIYKANLVTVLFLFSKFAFACQNVLCDNGVESNGCAIALTEAALQRYLYLCFAFFTATLILYFLRRKGFGIVIVCFLSLLLQPGWFSKINAGDLCSNSIVIQAIVLSVISSVCLICQFIFWIIEKRSFNKQMP